MSSSKYAHAALIGILGTITLYLLLSYFDEYVPVFNSAVRLMLAALISGYLIYRFLYRKL